MTTMYRIIHYLPALFQHHFIRRFTHHLTASVDIHLIQHLMQQEHQLGKLCTNTITTFYEALVLPRMPHCGLHPPPLRLSVRPPVFYCISHFYNKIH